MTHKWQYTRTETIEVEVPASIHSEEGFLNWLAEHLDKRTANFVVVDEFVGEAHEIKEP